MNKLYFGDNLDILREYVENESVDLIYLDPPFNSQARYNVLFQTPKEDALAAQVEAFHDTWTWEDDATWSYNEIMSSGGNIARLIEALTVALGHSDMMAYLVMMTVRLKELKKKLKSTGSLYLHCDPTASHYLKIIMDAIFSPERFEAEIIWKRTNARGTKGKWPRLHDTILFYSNGKVKNFIPQIVPGEMSKLPHTLIKGPDGLKYQTYELTGAGITKSGESGKPWRGYNPSDLGRHWGCSVDELERLEAHGLIHWPKDGGWPRRRDASPFDPENRMVTVGDVWTDIDRLNQKAKERMGYPTQKPLTLLERIINASSSKGDVVLDPFCGCGTTIEASERAGRRWIGIDVAIHAIKVIEGRLNERLGDVKYQIEGMPRDFQSAVKLAEKNKYQFQWWANYLFNPHALREQKKGADRGIDGEIFFPNGPGRPWGRMLTSVKGGQNVGPGFVRDFRGVLDRERAEMGLFICLNHPTSAMRTEAASAGLAATVHGDIPRLQIVAIEDWFKGKLPQLPPLEHLPTAAFASSKRRHKGRSNPPNSLQAELPLSFTGGMSQHHVEGLIRHFNPGMVVGDRVAV